MRTINHYTINTGHMRVSHPEEVDKSIYFIMKNYVDKALEEDGTGFLEGTRLKITREGSCYVATIYGNYENDWFPLLNTCGTGNERDRMYLWKLFTKFSQTDNGIEQFPPPVPYILDYVFPASAFHPSFLSWSGDFCRCLGWMMLFPEEIR